MTLAILPRLARGLSLAAGMALMLSGAPAQAQSLTPDQKKAVTDLIRETLLKNPEIIQEALVELERRNTVAQAQAQRSAVTAEKARLVDPATSVIVGNPDRKSVV